jgi:hypothetical protein
VLGQRYGGRSKAEALREELELQLPYVRARSVPKRIEEAIADGDVNWADFDLVAFALGRPTTELLINEQLWRLETRPLSLNCWVEPLGIGGHAIASGTDRARGCLECLYTDTEGDAFVANRASFAAPGQSFGRDTAGCGTLYTPYGSIDAQRTAILAATLAVDALTGKATQNPLRSWRGDSELFEAAGFRLSARFAATDAQLAGHQYEYVNPHCRVCGRGGDLD